MKARFVFVLPVVFAAAGLIGCGDDAEPRDPHGGGAQSTVQVQPAPIQPAQIINRGPCGVGTSPTCP